MNYKNLIFVLLLVFTGNLYAAEKPQAQVDKGRSLPLECDAIADSQEMLCITKTESAYGPFDDVIFYHLDKMGAVTFLGSHSDAISTFAGFGFSSGGKYLWISWAEEGHPYFEFYRTIDFIKQGTKASMHYILHDYYFMQFESFTDAGIVTYSQIEDNSEDRTIDEEKLNSNNIVPTNRQSHLNYIKLNINENL